MSCDKLWDEAWQGVGNGVSVARGCVLCLWLLIWVSRTKMQLGGERSMEVTGEVRSVFFWFGDAPGTWEQKQLAWRAWDIYHTSSSSPPPPPPYFLWGKHITLLPQLVKKKKLTSWSQGENGRKHDAVDETETCDHLDLCLLEYFVVRKEKYRHYKSVLRTTVTQELSDNIEVASVVVVLTPSPLYPNPLCIILSYLPSCIYISSFLWFTTLQKNISGYFSLFEIRKFS